MDALRREGELSTLQARQRQLQRELVRVERELVQAERRMLAAEKRIANLPPDARRAA
jgi:predicted  nucleic acid-binding Zn-ribbon protein